MKQITHPNLILLQLVIEVLDQDLDLVEIIFLTAQSKGSLAGYQLCFADVKVHIGVHIRISVWQWHIAVNT